MTREEIPIAMRRRIIERDDGLCVYCGEKPWQLHIDHVIPVSRGGMNTYGNLVVACSHCNCRKGAKILPWAWEWVTQREREYADLEAAESWAWLEEDGCLPAELVENFEVAA